MKACYRRTSFLLIFTMLFCGLPVTQLLAEESAKSVRLYPYSVDAPEHAQPSAETRYKQGGFALGGLLGGFVGFAVGCAVMAPFVAIAPAMIVGGIVGAAVGGIGLAAYLGSRKAKKYNEPLKEIKDLVSKAQAIDDVQKRDQMLLDGIILTEKPADYQYLAKHATSAEVKEKIMKMGAKRVDAHLFSGQSFDDEGARYKIIGGKQTISLDKDTISHEEIPLPEK
ncbi:hypothetical protein ACFL35_13590 [Candidatus Riflebacteria bacterium]